MITVYTQEGCGRCKVLKMKLQQKGVAYEECTDTARMTALGISSLPAMEKDGVLMTFEEAVKYLNER